MKKSYRNHGFTLLELLVTLAIIAILASIAVPNMSDTTKRNAVKAAKRNYLGGLSFARSEALSRGRTISMCPSVNGDDCEEVNFDWSNGFIVFIDNGSGSNAGNGLRENDEEVLLAHDNSPATVVAFSSLDFSGSTTTEAKLQSVSWNYQGYVANRQRIKVLICHRDGEQKFARGLFVEPSGRVMSSRDSDKDGIHESMFYSNDGDSAVEANLTCD